MSVQHHGSGRWPANLVLSHLPECRRIGEKRVKGIKGGDHPVRRRQDTAWAAGEQSHCSYADSDGLETVEAWECHPDCPVRMLDEQSGFCGAQGGKDNRGREHGFKGPRYSPRKDNWGEPRDELGGASRFFYCAKASRGERNRGIDWSQRRWLRVAWPTWGFQGRPRSRLRDRRVIADNTHPTVKPVKLMQWLVRLVTPGRGLVLDPFCGSGSTLVAAVAEGRAAVGIDADPHAIEIAARRLDAALDEQAKELPFAEIEDTSTAPRSRLKRASTSRRSPARAGSRKAADAAPS